MVRMLNAATLLAAWETALSQPPLLRPLALLSAVWPDSSAEEWGARPIGERDGSLLRLREAWFGTRIEAIARCPTCNETLEIAFETSDVLTEAPKSREYFEIDTAGRCVKFRLPTTADLVEAAHHNGAEASQCLLGRCVMEAKELPQTSIDTVLQAMAEADPQADVQIALSCSNCRHSWSLAFDIVSHLWGEVEDWAHRMLREVGRLASAYGWSEQEILVMSALRRRRYIELIEG